MLNCDNFILQGQEEAVENCSFGLHTEEKSTHKNNKFPGIHLAIGKQFSFCLIQRLFQTNTLVTQCNMAEYYHSYKRHNFKSLEKFSCI